jgi:hypothetical protein
MVQLIAIPLASNSLKRMRYALTIFILTTLALGQSAPSGPSSTQVSSENASPVQGVPTDQENSRKARTILDQAIQALGGQAFLSFRDLTQEGRRYSFHRGRPNSLGTLFWRFQKYPDKDRIEFTKQRDVIRIYNGDKGYEVTYKGVHNVEMKDDLEPYLRRRHYALFIVLRGWINEPGVALFYEGQTVAAQKQTDKVTIMNAKNEAVTLFFDIETHLPVKKTFTWRDPTDKERNVEEEIYDNYRSVQNIMTPFDNTSFFNGDMSAQSFLTSASYNRNFDDSFFDPNRASISGNKKH